MTPGNPLVRLAGAAGIVIPPAIPVVEFRSSDQRPAAAASHLITRIAPAAVRLAAWVAALWIVSSSADGQVLVTGATGTHDPSTIIKDGNVHAVFMTGRNVPSAWSTDMRHWNPGAPVFPNGPPAWTTEAVPGFNGSFWAPDVAYFNGKFHCYYSCSVWGTIDSAIGVATSPSLANPVWTDLGKVVQSDPIREAGPNTDHTSHNCIDPSILVDTDGRVWLTFGSYSSGIVIREINPATGKLLNSSWKQVANNNGGKWGSTEEGAFLYKRGGYYYLFVNFGACCSGLDSTYNMRVGRSGSPTGPFLDREGRDMATGGGTVIFESTGEFIGPGHPGILQENGRHWLSHHYYHGMLNGAATLGIRELKWTGDGWPVVTGDWSASYPFDVDGRDQGGKFNGTLVDGAAVVDDPARGKVLALNGGSQHVTLPLPVANALSFSAWVKWDGGPAWQRIVDFGRGTTRYLYLTPSGGSGKLRFAIANGAGEEGLDAATSLPIGTWCHVAVTLDEYSARLYLNGRLVANGVITVKPWEVLARNLYVGRSQFNGDPFFRGRMDDLRIHGRALTGGEVARLAGTQLGGTSAVAYWNFEEGEAHAYVPHVPGTNGAYDGGIPDVSGNGQPLSAWSDNAGWYRPDVAAAATPATGAVNRLSYQNAAGSSSLSAVGTELSEWSPTTWTIEATIRPDNAYAGFQTIVGRDSHGAYASDPALAALYFSIRPNARLAIAFADAAGNYWNLESANHAISSGQWQSVVATSDGKTLRLFRKNVTTGATKYALLGSLNLSASADPALSLGAGDGASWDAGVITVGRGLYAGLHTDRFLGCLDDVRLSNGALTPQEFLYRDSPTVAHWNFEEGAAEAFVPYAPAAGGGFDGSIRDVSGNANPLSAHAANWVRYRAEVPLGFTPGTGLRNTLSVRNANDFPSLSAIGTALTGWTPREWTIEAAVRPDNANGGYQAIVGRDGFGASPGDPALSALYFSLRPNGKLAIAFADAAGNHWNLESPANTIVSGQWQAVAATCDGARLRLYRRNITVGDLVHSLVGTLDVSGSSNPALSAGSGDGADWDAGVITVSRGLFNSNHTDRFIGHIDDVRLSSAALAPGQLLYGDAGVDPDADGLPDAWEANHYPPSRFGPADDNDGDGQTNGDEFVAGTNPMDGGDAATLRVVTATPALFEFNGKAGRAYTLQRARSLEKAVWEDLRILGPLEADGVVRVGDPTAPAGRGFYRLRIERMQYP